MSEAQKFNVVLDAELKQVDARRHARDLADAPPKSSQAPSGAAASAPPSLEEVRQEAHKRQLVGLAFSGGGIRSATFNLDFTMADARAARVTYVLGQWNGKTPTPKENWIARRVVLAQAETEAEAILRADIDGFSVAPLEDRRFER